MLVLVWLVSRLLPLFRLVGDDPHALPPGVTIRNFSLQEVHPRLHLRKQLQLEVSNAEVPPNITGDNTSYLFPNVDSVKIISIVRKKKEDS